MTEVLRGPAHGPDGDRVEAGQPVAKSWPEWFVDDLRAHGQLVEGEPSARRRAGEQVRLKGTTTRGRKGQS